jgi:uncharacterized membrane protein YccC
MLFADGFWEIKNLSDTIAVVGLVLTLLSIWLSWWWTKRDIEKRIREAQQQTVDRLVRSLLQPDVAETGRSLREAREACRAKRWERAVDRCEQAKHRIPTFISLPGLDEEDRAKLQRAVDQLRDLVKQLEEVLAGKKRTELTSNKVKDLEDLITTLVTIEGKLRASGLR